MFKKIILMLYLPFAIQYALADQFDETSAQAEFITESMDENPYSLTSTKHLKSLKNIQHQQSYQTPFVQEISNSNKVRTLFVETHALPMVDIQITFNAGSARDQVLGEGLYGLSNMAAKLMIEGTDQLSAKQINSTFESLGAKYSFNAYRDMFIVRLRVLSDPDKLYPALNLMMHLIRYANFKQTGINSILSNTQIGQKQVQENTSRLVSIQFYRSLYGDHPYAQPTVGTVGSLRKITSSLLKKFRDELLVAQNSNIAITGQLDKDQAQQISELISINLPQGSAQPALIQPHEKKGLNVTVIKRDSVQSNVMMGHLGIAMNNPDRIALEVANQIFGGDSFNSILSKELRIKRGLTYSARSTLTSTQVPGIFNLTYSTKQPDLLPSLEIAYQALVDFSQQSISDTLLKETKENILRSFPMLLTSNANINAQIASIGFYGFDSNYLNQYQNQVQQLKTSDLEYAIRTYLQPENLTIVVVSNDHNADEIKERLQEKLESNPVKSIDQMHQDSD